MRLWNTFDNSLIIFTVARLINTRTQFAFSTCWNSPFFYRRTFHRHSQIIMNDRFTQNKRHFEKRIAPYQRFQSHCFISNVVLSLETVALSSITTPAIVFFVLYYPTSLTVWSHMLRLIQLRFSLFYIGYVLYLVVNFSQL